MNLRKLREAQGTFLARYPGGFANPEMVAVGKKHNVDKVAAQAQEALAKKNFNKTGMQNSQVLDDVVKIVTRSSMVSVFEKPKFRDYVRGLSRDDRAGLVEGYRKLFHGNQEKGFNEVLDILQAGKLGKWSLMTICLLYLRPTVEVFVKPTTTKNVIRQFDVEDLVYKPTPTWAFYAAYRDLIAQMKGQVDASLSPNNAAFTGFLMMTSAT